ncbi:MAG TPA: hypothetical protein HA359_01580 [Candidatus Poseidoniaceae archaeon]|nr:MAG TPA: hypothetical protein D7H84_01580 [Candidatus Poseidoniales archaeon]HII22928.1 hypothetical protein [Candidatus Poseidoniaceae archaeon]
MLNNDEDSNNTASQSNTSQTRMGKMMSIEWLGQTIASGSWIVSVFVYGLTSTGDYLQLVAASSWMLSNIASVISIK